MLFRPILDVARGRAAGYEATALPTAGARPSADRPASAASVASTLQLALTQLSTLPANTFMTLPLQAEHLDDQRVSGVLRRAGNLGGAVLDLVGAIDRGQVDTLHVQLAEFREAGALLAIGGQLSYQPDVSVIVGLKPAIIRLGRDWTRDLDGSERKRTAISMVGRLAGELDAWILADGISTAGEMRALAGLDVPLAQGPFIALAAPGWPDVSDAARRALPNRPVSIDSTVRPLVQPAFSTTDATAAVTVLPDTTGFDVVVVVDHRRRPTALLEHDGVGWLSRRLSTVFVETPPADAASRAMARPPADRFTPLVCTDETGRFIGIVRVEALLAHLASAASD